MCLLIPVAFSDRFRRLETPLAAVLGGSDQAEAGQHRSGVRFHTLLTSEPF